MYMEARSANTFNNGKDGTDGLKAFGLLGSCMGRKPKIRKRSDQNLKSMTTIWESVQRRRGGPQKPVPVQTMRSVSGPKA